MEKRHGYVLMSLRSTRQFIQANRDRLPSVYASGAWKRLNDIIAQFEEHVATQAANRYLGQGETQRSYALRAALQRDHMAPLARVAASVLTESPELEPFRLPRNTLAAVRLCAYARGMAKAAAPYKAMFIAAGLAEDFLEQLAGAADAVVDSLNRRKHLSATRAGATEGIVRLSSQARKVVHVLDAMVRSALHADEPLLSAWRMSQRVELTGTRSARSAPPTAATETVQAEDIPVLVGEVVTATLPALASAEAHTFPRRLDQAASPAPALLPRFLRATPGMSESEHPLADVDTQDPAEG